MITARKSNLTHIMKAKHEIPSPSVEHHACLLAGHNVYGIAANTAMYKLMPFISAMYLSLSPIQLDHSDMEQMLLVFPYPQLL